MAYNSVNYTGAQGFLESKLDQQDENTTIIRSRMRRCLGSFDKASGETFVVMGFAVEPEHSQLRFKFEYTGGSASPETITLTFFINGTTNTASATFSHTNGTNPANYTGTLAITPLDFSNIGAGIFMFGGGGKFRKTTFYLE